MASRRSSPAWILLMIGLSLLGLLVSVVWGVAIRLGYLPP